MLRLSTAFFGRRAFAFAILARAAYSQGEKQRDIALQKQAFARNITMTEPLSEQKNISSLPSIPENGCITLIGMAGAGKTTVGRLVARSLDWAFVDCDHVIEAAFAASLQTVADAMTKEDFINVEAEIVGRLRLCRTVIATGGSVVYRASTMEHLASLGPVIYLEAPMNVVLERIARNPDRGLAIAPGQTVEELFLEREALYRRYASLVVSTAGVSPAESARRALEEIARWYA